DPSEDADDDWCTNFLDQEFEVGRTRDWSHANAVIPMDGGRTWLVSYRHLDELIAFRAVDEPEGPAGSIRWRMGPTPTSDFEMEGDGLWFWHQHAPELEPDGTLMVYDNGNGRTDADAPFSRAVRYELDTASMTVRQVWEHVMPNRLYASFLGDADLLDGTVLITHGGQFAPCGLEGQDGNFFFGQIVEVDEATGDIVWQITTRDDERCTGWAIYRAERIPTIYPPEFVVTTD
ncbi:MAG: aryl-sulfate sulfotransferase, partial [Nitriliruptorales bacterium]|nr:aryl-sulfate sulfotransferase [Nitriliruptorales bacterium]